MYRQYKIPIPLKIGLQNLKQSSVDWMRKISMMNDLKAFRKILKN